jgi:hypothetical protein
MTEQRLAYPIIRRDGLPFRDEHGTEFTFASRTEAERRLLRGERVRPTKGPMRSSSAS